MSGAAAITEGGGGAGAGAAAAAASGAGTIANPGTVAVSGTAGEGGAAGAGDLKWLGETVPDDIKGYVGNKGWKGPGDVVDGYRNLEKLVGSHRLALPKDENDADGWNKTYDALGRPKTPAEYKLPTPESGGDPAFTKTVSEVMHKTGLNTKQATALATWWNEYYVNAEKAAEEKYATDSAQAMDKLKQEWGGAYNERIETAKRAARTFAIDQKMADVMERGMGTSAFMDLMYRVGHALGEHRGDAGLDGKAGAGALTPEQAKGEIERLKADREWSIAYAKGDAEKKKRMEQLHAWAYPSAG